MRKLILATVIAIPVTRADMAVAVKAEDTTIIEKDNDTGDKTVVKKREELNI